MAQTYSIEFKEEACKRVQSGVPAAQVARELGVNVNTLYIWMSRFKEHPTEPFVGSGNLHQEDAQLRALKKRIKDLEEENEIPKKSKRLLCKEPEVIRYLSMEQNRSRYRIAKMAQWLQVSKSGYYAWRKRSKSLRCIENEALLQEIIGIHEASRNTYGGRKITHEINRKSQMPVNHKRVERIMRENGIRSKSHKKYKATTNSKHNLPVAENILNRDFTADRPGQKMVSDITYIPTDEGWLYLAGVMDLCGDKIVGTAMDGRMTKELVISALKDAIHHTKITKGCILHSDRGSQYCSLDYQELAKEHGFISSMSRKGNCWDNAPMESFWGKLKQEWLNKRHFHTREEARSAVFEYIWIFYNRKRIHEANGYLTSEEYYRIHQTDLKVA